MKHTRDLTQFWNWLPAFRAIAETEHLPSAADSMNLTAPALSRTLRLLEDQLGQPLFDREGRRLKLNGDGAMLLAAVRRAMRLVHEGVEAIQGVQFSGPMKISVPGPFAPHFVLPALARFTSAHPNVIPHVRAVPGSEVNGMLKRGQLDLAVLDDPMPDEALAIEPLAVLRHDLYIAPALHPGRSDATREPGLGEREEGESDRGEGAPLDLDLLPPFAAPVPDANGVTHDAWPIDRPRRISLRVTHMQVALDAVRSGQCVAVLPEVVAAANGLVALGVEGIPDTRLYALYRPSLPIAGRTEALLQVMRDALKQPDLNN